MAPSLSPSEVPPCVECTDEAADWMSNNGITCSTLGAVHDLKSHCEQQYFINQQLCEMTCFENGYRNTMGQIALHKLVCVLLLIQLGVAFPLWCSLLSHRSFPRISILFLLPVFLELILICAITCILVYSGYFLVTMRSFNSLCVTLFLWAATRGAVYSSFSQDIDRIFASS